MNDQPRWPRFRKVHKTVYTVCHIDAEGELVVELFYDKQLALHQLQSFINSGVPVNFNETTVH